MQRCLSCGATYAPVQQGVFYPHVCAPLSGPELAAAVAAGLVQLPAGETVDDAVGRRTYLRANARNENVTGPPPATGGPSPIVSEGAGVVTVPDPVLSVVVAVPPVVGPPAPGGA